MIDFDDLLFTWSLSMNKNLLMNNWLPQIKRNDYLISLFLFCFVFLTTFPKYLLILTDLNPATTYAYFFEKIRHPLTPITNLQNDTHGSKIAFRLTVPLLCKLLGIGFSKAGREIVLIYIIQSLLLFPFFFVLLRLLRRFGSSANAIFIAIACSGTYIAKSFFWDYDFWFDGFAYFFMLLGISSRKPINIFIWLQLACWTDERAVVALPAIFIFHLLQTNKPTSLSEFSWIKADFYRHPYFSVVIVGVTYFACRLILRNKFDLITPDGANAGVSLALVPFQLKHRLVGIFLTFEGLWLVVGFAFYYLFKRGGNKLLIAALLAIFIIQLLVAYSVYDITRSVTYAYPMVIVCYLLYMSLNTAEQRSWIIVAAITCIIIPTQYLIYFPRQIPWTIASYDEMKLVLKSISSILTR